MSGRERLISADDHVDLAHDAVKAHLATKFHDDYDRALGRFAAAMAKSTSNEANQRWREQQDNDETFAPPDGGVHYTRPGHYEAKARLADMDDDGIDVSSTYCEVSAFRYLYMLDRGSREATRAFNTALAEYEAVDPQRLVVSYQIPIHDIEGAVKEVEWVAARGGRSLQLPVFPSELGLPDYWESRYDPLWAAISEAGLPICCHIGMNTQLEGLAQRDPTPQRGIFVPMVPLSAGEALGMLVLGGVFERFPKLQVVYVEPGIGWVSWWLQIVDDMATRQGYDYPGLKELPSFYFRRNVFLTFIDEDDVLYHARKRLGVENIMWSSDYPHPVTSFPHSRKIVDELFADATAEERQLMVEGNAARVWHL